MRRTRLLVVLPAAGALLFTGLAPAAAGDYDDRDRGRDDAWAEVLSIGDEAELERGGDQVEVTFKYKCEDGDRDDEDVTADVVLDNRGRYEADDVALRCNGRAQSVTATLDQESDREAREGGRAHVTVTLTADDDVLDSDTERVRIVDEDNRNGRDRDGRHHDDDKRHHDDDDR
jgi:hypothetical protein